VAQTAGHAPVRGQSVNRTSVARTQPPQANCFIAGPNRVSSQEQSKDAVASQRPAK
jgi:hypothetical protein